MIRNRSLAADDRSVSEVVGYVLVISLVITTVGVVSVSGIGVLQDAREAEQIENAKRAFDLLADNMEDIYREGAPSRSTEIQLGSAQLVAQETTRFNVSWINSTSDRQFQSSNITSVVYRGDGESRLIYDAGAIFRVSQSGGEGTVLREPPLIVTPERTVITTPRTTSRGTSAVSGSTALIRATRLSESVLARNTQYTNITVNVTSPHWRVWRTALDGRENINCGSGDPATETISCELLDGNSPGVFYLTQTQIRVELTR
jgi:3',5'-cyclic AMP phosphodiesterase CpdA